MRNEGGRVRIITLIEAGAFLLGVGIWFALERAGHPTLGAILGTIAWTLITDAEHFAAVNLGWGNPLFKGYPFDLTPPE